jgi:hypothetical protein
VLLVLLLVLVVVLALTTLAATTATTTAAAATATGSSSLAKLHSCDDAMLYACYNKLLAFFLCCIALKLSFTGIYTV